MKTRFVLLLLAAGMLVSACSLQQEEVTVATEQTALQERMPPADEVRETSIPEMTTAEQIPSGQESECEGKAVILTECAESTARNIELNAAALRPDSDIWTLGGNTVYFGEYDGIPTVYRVLATSQTQTAVQEQDILLLDCDTVLAAKAFDNNFARNEGQIKQPSEWKFSDLELWLNGEAFYENSSVFSDEEKAAIASTRLDDVFIPYTIGNWEYTDYGSVDHVFLLSADEANRLYADNSARAKGGVSDSWWVRSTFGDSGNGNGSIHWDGHICNNSISNFGIGVSPALNLKLTSILFASEICPEGSADMAETDAAQSATAKEWKLTLLDPGMNVKVTEGRAVTRSAADAGDVITVPYTFSGENAAWIAIMITDKVVTDPGAKVCYYGAMQKVSAGTVSGTGAFVLPAGLQTKISGSDYYVYILAERINGKYETDYASDVFEITIPEK